MDFEQIRDLLAGNKIIIFHDEISKPVQPDEIGIVETAAWLKEIMESFGARVKSFSFLLDLAAMKTIIEKEKPLLVFNMVDSVAGKGRLAHLAPALFAALEIPYTGCNNNSIFMVSDKLLAKKIMRQNAIPTPDWTENGGDIGPGLYIVKSVYEHASIGLDDANVVGQRDVQEKIAERREKFGGEWFAEKYIDGREFSIPLLEISGKTEVLPLYEICYRDYPRDKRKIQDYASKWDEDSFGYNASYREFFFPEKDFALLDKINSVAKKCQEVFELSGYARIDMRVTEDGIPMVIDINPNPSIEPSLGFFLSAARIDIDYRKVIGYMLLAALRDKVKSYAAA